ncbi:ATP-binding cassette domain-containing protein [Aliamphritea spongicola]|nr:ATP-binding cassette domain-containing protein [Aliamphritea spongicola]
MAGGAQVLLADEPTKGLDISRRDHVVSQLISQAADGVLLTITHDVAVARQIGGRIMVMKDGVLLEEGLAEDVLSNPQHAYTRELISADPAKWWQPPRKVFAEDSKPLISARQLTVGRGKQALVSGLDFKVHPGEVVGVVGDSGCGKSTLGDTLLGLNPPHAGEVARREGVSGHHWQKLYQDPTAAVSHAVSLRTLLMDLIQLHDLDVTSVPALMARLGLSDALLERSASEVSGELQRFCLLRILLLKPVFLFADEPTSRLDPVTTREVSQLLVDLAREQGCAVMLVSHDPMLIEKRCDRVIQLTA